MFCSQCGAANDGSARFCLKCGATLAAPAPGPAQQPPPPAPAPIPFGGSTAPSIDPRMRGGPTLPLPQAGKTYAQGKTPWVAVVLSIVLPGVGQFYNGDAKKGAIMLVGALVSHGLMWTLCFGVLPLLGLCIWSAIDGYQVASGKSPIW